NQRTTERNILCGTSQMTVLSWHGPLLPIASSHLCQCGFGLRQPEVHLHSAVQGDSSRQGVASLLTLCCLEIQRAEPAVAVGHGRAHAEFLGQGEGLLVVGFHLRVLWWLTPCCNVAEEAQGICLVAPFLVRTCMRQRTHGEGVCLPQAACQHLCLPEGE